MSRRGAASKLGLCAAIALAVSLPFGSAGAAHYRVLYSFSGGADGLGPQALTIGSDGNLYGTTSDNGRPLKSTRGLSGGVVFRFNPAGSLTVLHTFPPAPTCSYTRDICAGWDPDRYDGSVPEGALIRDHDGNLYGATQFGGPANDGVVYRINADGSEQVLHAFIGGKDGRNPFGYLVLDGKGNLYGTTVGGGGACTEKQSCGTVFKIARDGTETVLHAFAGGSSDGQEPGGGLISDHAGLLYGTTELGGSGGLGTIFSITPDGSEKILYAFSEQSLNVPDAPLFLDASGNLYGATPWAENTEGGGVFELDAEGNWNAVYTFPGNGEDGLLPNGVIKDASGNLFGTTSEGGPRCGTYETGCGTIFEIAPDGTETILREFGQKYGDGRVPAWAMVADKKGRLYGTTAMGGTGHCTFGCGIIFSITP